MMRVLAIETTDQAGSVAALEDARAWRAQDLDAAARSAVSLAPAIGELLEALGWRPADVRLVAVASGPGSFTGLRVGVTTAKMFAYATGAEVIGVNTLEVIAGQSPAEVQHLWAVMDALRSQVFAAEFVREGGIWQAASETMLLDDAVWLAKLKPGEAVSGPGLGRLGPKIPRGVEVVAEEFWRPKAIGVGQLGLRHWRAGRRDEVGALVPHYFRLSAAEEKRDATLDD